MDNAGYIGISRQLSLLDTYNIVANNIANVNTSAFKRKFIVMNESNEMIKSLSFAGETGEAWDRNVGFFKKTDGPLNMAIGHPNTYFMVDTPNGIRYTRNGNFRLDINGNLVTAEGFTVASSDGGIINIPTNSVSITITQNGELSADGVVVNKVGAFRLDDASKLLKVGDSLIKYDGATQVAQMPEIHQGMLEDSNVNAIAETTGLISVKGSIDEITNILDMLSKASSSLLYVTLNVR